MFHPDILNAVISCLEDSEAEVIRECCWVIFNLIEGSSEEQFESLINDDCISFLVDLIEIKDVKVLKIVLQTLESILERGEDKAKMDQEANPYAYAIESFPDALRNLELLQEHKNEDIFNLAADILENYFGAKELQNDEEEHYDFS